MSQLLDPQDILDLHKEYADEFATLAQSGLNAAFSSLSQSGIFDYYPAHIIINWPDIGQPNREINLPELPKAIEPEKVPELDRMKDIPNPNYGSAPSPGFGSPPGYNAPSKPPQSTPTLNATAPASEQLGAMPPVPVYLSMPALVLPYPTVTVPDAPVLTMPVFNGVKPAPLNLPEAQEIIDAYTTEQEAHRNMLPAFMRSNADALITSYIPEYADLRARINNALIAYTHPTDGGGVGIPSNIEGAIMARASERNNIEFQRAVDTAIDTIGKRGFTMPPGAMMAVLRQSRMAMGDAQVKSSTDIATKNLELEQANFQFMLKLGEQLEEKCIETITQYLSLALQIDAQSIASAKEILNAYLGAYNLQVMVYKAMYDGYMADATVYKAGIDALEAEVRVYEAEIKAELAKTDVNKATVDILSAVASVNSTLAQSYKYQIDAAMAPLEITRLEVAIYEARVRAYAAEVGAYESRWNAYKAEVDGELGKYQAYTAQANAYTAQVAGYRAQVDAYSAQVSAYGETNRSIGVSNESEIRGFTAVVDAKVKNFDALVASYTAQSNSAIAQSQIEVEYWRTKANVIFQEYNSSLNQTFEYAREQMNLFRGQMEAAISAANGLAHAANVAGSLASGAMTGLSTFAGTLVTAEQ